MSSKTKNDQNLDWLKEPMSDDFKNKVLAAALIELDINKANSGLSSPFDFKSTFKFNFNWIWTFAVSMALVAMMAIRFSGLIDINSPTTTFDDLALLTPDEIELIENLDVLEKIDTIDLERIRQEMKKKGKKS